MAIIKRISSKSSVVKLVDYLTKEEKTDRHIISGIDCNPDNLANEFEVVKLQYNKTCGITYHHHIQSFKPGELTTEKAHKIGLEWAENNFKGHQCFVVTHKDKEHIHNHVVVNSVSIETGKKLVSNKTTLKEIKEDNDRICEREKLSIPEKKQNRYWTQAEIQTAEKGESWKFRLMNQIDICKSKSKNKKEFIGNMNKAGYEVNWTDSRKYITYITPEKMKCRDRKLPKEYSKEEMINGFGEIETKEFIGGTEQGDNGFNKVEPNIQVGNGEFSPEGINSAISRIIETVSKSAERAVGKNSEHNIDAGGKDKNSTEKQRGGIERDRERGR
jgi:hypothetical protein